MDCGGTFPPECMDFDHRPGEGKIMAVGRMTGLARSRIEAEVAKTDLVCSNCHRIRTKARTKENPRRRVVTAYEP